MYHEHGTQAVYYCTITKKGVPYEKLTGDKISDYIH